MLRSAGSELSDARVDGSFARGTTAPALSSVASHSGTGTDPGNLPLRHDGPLIHPGNPAHGAERSLARPSAVIAPPPARAARASRRGIGTWLVAFVSLAGLGGAAAGVWWLSTQGETGGEPPRPALSTIDPSVVEIAAEPALPPGHVPASPKPSPVVPSPAPAAAAPRPQHASGTGQPAPQASSSGTPPSSSATQPSNPNPFSLPFPITFPPVLSSTGLPPLGLPAPQSPTPTPAPTAAPQPAPANPASGLQQCTQASTLADTDLDAAVGQYQLCENSVGRTAATPARAKIASVGVARATALATQGRCDEARRVVSALSRIGVHRPAQRAMENAGCRT